MLEMDHVSRDRRLQAAARNLEVALEMFGLGESILREKLRRTHPGASDAEIEEKLVAWMRTRPGAEYGDSAGRPRPVPR